MALPDDYAIYPILTELAACLCAELGSEASSCFCGVIVNDIPVPLSDDCDPCAAGYVRLDTAYPSTVQFPALDDTATCRATMAFGVSVGIQRCLPMGDSAGNPPTPEELAEYARQVFADMAAIRRAIACCLVDAKFEDIEYVMGTYTQLSAQEGVGGGEWTLTIRERF